MTDELKKGYKQTDVGIIPEDWEIKSLEDVCIPSGLIRGPFGGALKKECFVEKGHKVYEQRNAIYRNPTIGNYFINNSKFQELKRFEVKASDFIVSCSGTIGRIYQIPKTAAKGVINQALLIIKTDNNKIVDKYFFYYFDWEKFQTKIVDNIQGGAMPNLVGMNVFRETPIPLPSLPEQQAIAEVLSDVDALVTSLDQLITKKRNIKQGAMQLLLTGKKRLPNFSGDWETKKLGDIGTFSKGKGIKKDDVISEGIPCIRYGEIYTRHNDYIKSYTSFISQVVAVESVELKKGDLLFAGSGETAEEIGKCVAFIGDEKVFAGGDIVILRPYSNCNSLFLGFLLNTPFVSKQKAKLGQGDAVVHISGKNLSEVKIPFPPTKEEQKAIAQILSEMNAEIEALETRRDKYKAVKQGMMQELLTGKTRLIVR